MTQHLAECFRRFAEWSPGNAVSAILDEEADGGEVLATIRGTIVNYVEEQIGVS